MLSSLRLCLLVVEHRAINRGEPMSAKISRGSSHLGGAALHFRPSCEAPRLHCSLLGTARCVTTVYSNLTQQGMSQGGSISTALTMKTPSDRRKCWWTPAASSYGKMIE